MTPDRLQKLQKCTDLMGEIHAAVKRIGLAPLDATGALKAIIRIWDCADSGLESDADVALRILNEELDIAEGKTVMLGRTQ